MTTALCGHCGGEVASLDRFCGSCGLAVGGRGEPEANQVERRGVDWRLFFYVTVFALVGVAAGIGVGYLTTDVLFPAEGDAQITVLTLGLKLHIDRFVVRSDGLDR